MTQPKQHTSVALVASLSVFNPNPKILQCAWIQSQFNFQIGLECKTLLPNMAIKHRLKFIVLAITLFVYRALIWDCQVCNYLTVLPYNTLTVWFYWFTNIGHRVTLVSLSTFMAKGQELSAEKRNVIVDHVQLVCLVSTVQKHNIYQALKVTKKLQLNNITK